VPLFCQLQRHQTPAKAGQRNNRSRFKETETLITAAILNAQDKMLLCQKKIVYGEVNLSISTNITTMAFKVGANN